MNTQEDVLKEIYMSDCILRDKEMEMMKNVDDSYLDYLEELHKRICDNQIHLSKQEFEKLESLFNQFYFDYGFVQFKRGLELGLILKDIH